MQFSRSLRFLVLIKDPSFKTLSEDIQVWMLSMIAITVNHTPENFDGIVALVKNRAFRAMDEKDQKKLLQAIVENPKILDNLRSLKHLIVFDYLNLKAQINCLKILTYRNALFFLQLKAFLEKGPFTPPSIEVKERLLNTAASSPALFSSFYSLAKNNTFNAFTSEMQIAFLNVIHALKPEVNRQTFIDQLIGFAEVVSCKNLPLQICLDLFSLIETNTSQLGKIKCWVLGSVIWERLGDQEKSLLLVTMKKLFILPNSLDDFAQKLNESWEAIGIAKINMLNIDTEELASFLLVIMNSSRSKDKLAQMEPELFETPYSQF